MVTVKFYKSSVAVFAEILLLLCCSVFNDIFRTAIPTIVFITNAVIYDQYTFNTAIDSSFSVTKQNYINKVLEEER